MSEPLAFRLRVLDEVTSTNDEVKRALEAGEPEGLALRARRQTGGYGRQGAPKAACTCRCCCAPRLTPPFSPP